MKIEKQKMKKIIAFLVFIFLIWEIFIHCTYLFRDTNREGRQNIVGFYDEEENSLDIVFVGASCVYRYWNCMQAWKRYGITSYNYSVGSMSSATTVFVIKEIEQTQTPQLIVFDVRKLLSRFPETPGGVWGTLDSQDYNFNRLSAVKYYCDLNNIGMNDAWADFIDIMTYHSNHEALSSELSWQLWDNRTDESLDKDGFYKGFSIMAEHDFVDEPSNTAENESVMLDEKQEIILVDILEYCKENNVPLLLVSSPFVVSQDDVMELNRIAEVAETYGVPFLNMNRCYEEMGLNFSSDFYDDNHVNFFGAEKYTDYLAKYILDHYDISGQRSDSVTASWDSVYGCYAQEAEAAEEKLRTIIDDKYKAFELEAAMKETDQAYNWLTMADNANITVLVLKAKPCDHMPSLESRSYLKRYGLFSEEIGWESPYMARFCEEVLYGSSTDTEHEGEMADDLPYFLSVRNDGREEPQLRIGEINYYDPSQEGIQMLAFDNNINEIIDSVAFQILEDGSLVMEHCEMGDGL